MSDSRSSLDALEVQVMRSCATDPLAHVIVDPRDTLGQIQASKADFDS
jgi:hypothetical protein